MKFRVKGEKKLAHPQFFPARTARRGERWMRNPGGKEFFQEHYVCFLKGRQDRRPADKNRLKPACAREEPSPWSPKESPSPPSAGLPAKTGGGREQKKTPLLSWKIGVSMD